jgi:hypothetical protein
MGQSSGQTGQGSGGQSGSLTDQAKNMASGVRESASGLMDEASRMAREQASGAADTARNLASQAGDKLMSAAEQQKSAGADYVGEIAEAVRRAANEFRQIPQASHYMLMAADQIDSVSESVRRRDINQMFGDVQNFARRQPTAFIGLTALAGFALVRFLKSSAAGSSGGGQGSWQQGAGQGQSPHLGAMSPGYSPGPPGMSQQRGGFTPQPGTSPGAMAGGFSPRT